MSKQTLIMLALFLVITMLQGLVVSLTIREKLRMKRRLDLLNKPAIKSFTTKHGEILDCIKIHKQLAFDHPLLKNHSIQLKPNRIGVTKRTKSKSSNSILSQLLPKHMICPKGTVMIKRIQEEDLAFNEMFSSRSKSSKFGLLDDDNRHDIYRAYQEVVFQNNGIGGMINIWSPEVTLDQYSMASIIVGSHDGPNDRLTLREIIQAGWAVIPTLFRNNATRLYAAWTRDNRATTGCYNIVCEGFVQTSNSFPLGIMLDQISTYDGTQYVLDLKIEQDHTSKAWWLYVEDEQMGYWPAALFETLKNGAEMVMWGGEVYNKGSEPSPAMGSGHFPEEGFQRASFIKNLQIFGTDEFPDVYDLRQVLTNHKCYRYDYKGDLPGMGHTIYFGGPPNC